jgi:hypothetical protein
MYTLHINYNILVVLLDGTTVQIQPDYSVKTNIHVLCILNVLTVNLNNAVLISDLGFREICIN